MSEEQRKKVESQAKAAVKFRKGWLIWPVLFLMVQLTSASSGVTAVSGAISKGAGLAGTGIAKAGYWGMDQYKDTDYYKEVQEASS